MSSLLNYVSVCIRDSIRFPHLFGTAVSSLAASPSPSGSGTSRVSCAPPARTGIAAGSSCPRIRSLSGCSAALEALILKGTARTGLDSPGTARLPLHGTAHIHILIVSVEIPVKTRFIPLISVKGRIAPLAVSLVCGLTEGRYKGVACVPCLLPAACLFLFRFKSVIKFIAIHTFILTASVCVFIDKAFKDR